MPPSGNTTVGLLVVGGGPAAHNAATAYREHGGQDAVLLVSNDTTAPYFRPSLSKEYLRDGSGEQDLPLAPDGYPDGIEVRLGTEVVELEPHERRARLADGSDIGFRSCVLATGAAPAPLPVPGAAGTAVLRSLADARDLRERAADARSAVIVGSGFIGCEAAVSLARLGLDVTVCGAERAPQQARLGDAVAERIAGWLRDEGVTVSGSTEVTGIDAGDATTTVRLAHGEPVEADLVLVAAGIEPSVSLAEAAGLALDRGRVVVDERMRSSVDGVLAAGDAALARNASAGRHLLVEHWDEAEAMGRIAGVTAAGGDDLWSDPPGFWTDIGEQTLNYVAWGDGHDEVRMTTHDNGGFTAWYGRGGVVVGVATHQADDDLERGTQLVRDGASMDATAPPPGPAPS